MICSRTHPFIFAAMSTLCNTRKNPCGLPTSTLQPKARVCLSRTHPHQRESGCVCHVPVAFCHHEVCTLYAHSNEAKYRCIQKKSLKGKDKVYAISFAGNRMVCGVTVMQTHTFQVLLASSQILNVQIFSHPVILYTHTRHVL